jgi:hypothetical protein
MVFLLQLGPIIDHLTCPSSGQATDSSHLRDPNSLPATQGQRYPYPENR